MHEINVLKSELRTSHEQRSDERKIYDRVFEQMSSPTNNSRVTDGY